jgi:hypothetical protein
MNMPDILAGGEFKGKPVKAVRAARIPSGFS